MANQTTDQQIPDAGVVYSAPARKFHWWAALLVLIMLPLGKIVADDPFKVSEAAGDRLKSLHMLLGFILLWLMVARLVYRLRHGAPPSDPTLASWQKGSSHATHWLLYLVLIALPLSGWIGVSMYGTRGLFGLVNLPPLAPVNQPLSEKVFAFHEWAAWAVVALVVAHIGAAIYHHFIRRDSVLTRMLPSLRRDG